MAKHFIVAAIDFGTTYSGYAYSFKDSYKTDPLKIFSNTWTDGCGALTLKQPTCALFDGNGKFHSFGYEAEDKYAKLASSDKHIGWKYFRHFKMSLHNKPNLSLKAKLRDDQSKLMKAIEVFAASIKYLKDHLIHKLTESSGVNETSVNDKQSQKAGILTNDILWVLTVPAIWSDSAKQFMRTAAEQAGIQERSARALR
ncbi:heat shock 70 kDa protein 12B-like [Ruditapes philippinarum]|uniref:heat shock 70 kDa protein 12B-like n=1 Tax=Ruditapes philippinarum TaxID=129788 RepID=UPI00295C14A4|nr:heat shock 70 kDa protein 12B-like [Ruditapes philippinarum]